MRARTLPTTATRAQQRTPRKYRNVPMMVDGMRFDSKREAGEWVKLRALERRGVIEGLTRQMPYDLTVNGVKVCRYVADFSYRERIAADTWQHVLADAKGVRTRDYLLKKKLMKAIYGIDIVEL